MKTRRIFSALLCALVSALIVTMLFGNPVCFADDSYEDPSTFVEIDVEDFGKTKVKVYQGFDFIDHNSAECDWKLALNAAVLSKTVYDKYASDVYGTLGYDIVYEQKDVEPQLGQPTFAMAYKLLIDENGNRKNVFSVTVKGTSTDRDKDTDVIDGAFAMFNASSSGVIEHLKAFMTQCTGQSIEELEKEDNYFFFTGHSLGAAVANVMSIKEDVLKLAGNDKGKIYTYTFESPHTCIAFFWMKVGEMSNAFNFKDVDDPVTNLPPYMWSTTYGTDVPFSTNDLNGGVLKALFPKTEMNSLRDYWTFLSHHNLIGNFAYILQMGNLIDDDYIEVNVNHNEIPTTSVLSEIVEFTRNDENEEWKMNSKEIYQYDEEVRLTERRICSVNGEVRERETYEYDSQGRIKQLMQTEYYARLDNDDSPCYIAYEFDKSGKPEKRWRVEEYTKAVKFRDIFIPIGDGLLTTYDEKGRVENIAMIYDVFGKSYVHRDYDFSYDEGRNSVDIDSYQWGYSGGVYERDYGAHAWEKDRLEYDEKQNPVRIEQEDPYGWFIREFKYDDNGRLISMEYVGTSELYEAPPEGELIEKEEYEYNEQGDMIWKSIWSKYDGENEIFYGITYYDNGEKKRVNMCDAICDIYWEYSEDGRLLWKDGTEDRMDYTQIEFTYDENGRLMNEQSMVYGINHDTDEGMATISVYAMNSKYYIYTDYPVNDRK